MPTKVSLKEALARRGGTKEGIPDRSGSAVVKLSLVPGHIRQPVAVARLLTKYGLSLRKAHDILDKLVKRERVAVELRSDDPAKARSDLAKLGIESDFIEIPDADVKSVREGLGISQADFAIRFGFEIDTIQNWEQGRNRPDAATRLLLKLIETQPEAVDSALTGRPLVEARRTRREQK